MNSRISKSKSKSKSRERKGKCFLCERETNQVCTSCNKVFYCSQEHYIYHRQQSYCFPFRIVWRSGKGKCMVASRDIKALELILFDTAIVVGPRNKSDAVCLECGKYTDGSFCCPVCTFPLCGETCQFGKTHSLECDILKTLKNIEDRDSLYQWITPFRLLLKMSTNQRIYRQVQFLMDHNSTTVQEDEALLKENRALLETFLKSDQLKSFSLEDFVWVKGILHTNSIMFGEQQSRALFPHFSLMNHSCIANAKHTIYIENRKMAVQAQTDIKEGEEIVINYVTFIQGTHLRRQKLKKVWKFDCCCSRCQDPTELNSHLSSLRCAKCEENFLTPEDPLNPDCDWVCRVHKSRISSKNCLNLIQEIKDYLYGSEKTNTIPELEKDLERFSELLHPNHYLLMLLKRKIISLYSTLPLKEVQRKDFLRIEELCNESISVLGLVDPGFPLWKSETLKDLGTAQMNLARTDFENGLILRPEFLERVKASMRTIEQASNCKSCIKIERKLDTGAPLTEEKNS